MNKWMILLLLCYGFNAQAQPQLKGGLETFVNNHKIYPRYSLQNCIAGTINISFKLNPNGEVLSSKISKGMGTDLDAEALRLIRLSSGKWIVPAGHDTAVAVIVPINFSISSSDCRNRSRQQIQQAVDNYIANQGLTNAVLNFYKSKEKGAIYTKEDEDKIIALKASLGYDEEYLMERLSDGQKKLKQKDKLGACEDFLFIKHMGSGLADEMLAKYCN